MKWVRRNISNEVQQLGEEALQISTGSPAPSPKLGTPLSKIFGVSDEVIASGSYVEGRLRDALIGGQFIISGSCGR